MTRHPLRKSQGLAVRTHPDEPDVKADDGERFKWKIMEIIPDSATYSAYDRFDALVAFATTGSANKVHELLPHIPRQTITAWKNGTKWWKPALEKVKEMLDEELDGRLTGVIKKAIKKMEERLEHGDEVVLKDGTIVEKEVAFRDIAVGFGLGIDKRQLLRGGATQIIRTVSDAEKLKQLQDRFKAIASPGRTINITPDKSDNAEQDS